MRKNALFQIHLLPRPRPYLKIGKNDLVGEHQFMGGVLWELGLVR
jgi:hypothetical protein